MVSDDAEARRGVPFAVLDVDGSDAAGHYAHKLVLVRCRACPLVRRSWSRSGHDADVAKTTFMTPSGHRGKRCAERDFGISNRDQFGLYTDAAVSLP
jgi:hypothetical protein